MDKVITEIIIVGAGASGLMTARELAKAGKKVIILEARDRIGGRIMPLSESDFGYHAEGGAEWIHGEAPITKALIKEAGLTLIPEQGEIWSARKGKLALHTSFILKNDDLKAKLESLKEDISIANFLAQHFNEEKDKDFVNSILKVVEGYDAADPNIISTFSLRDEWLSKPSMTEILDDCRIKEGYGALISFLKNECEKLGVEIHISTQVKKIQFQNGEVIVFDNADKEYEASKVVVTVPLPVLKDIDFVPAISEKLEAASKIGFGNVVKILIKFKTRWWENATENDLSKLFVMLCNEKFLTWWTQYPEVNAVFTGWMAGPQAAKHKDASDEELLDMALTSLSNVFKIDKSALIQEIENSKVINWSASPFTKGAYSYTAVNTEDAYEKLAEPVDGYLFFAGEALYPGDITATVEGALGSGVEVARKILES